MVFVKDTHIDWIDGAKGVAIVAVVLLHSLPCLREMGWMWHIGQAVPVFLFITAYLISMRFESLQMYFQWERFAKMLKKVFVPFVVVLLIQLVCYALIGRLPSIKTVVKLWGGEISPFVLGGLSLVYGFLCIITYNIIGKVTICRRMEASW